MNISNLLYNTLLAAINADLSKAIDIAHTYHFDDIDFATLILGPNNFYNIYKFYNKLDSTISLSNIIIPEGITIIPKQAFEQATLESIIIPASVTDIKSSAFEHAIISNIIFQNSLTIKKVESCAFSFCTEFSTIQLSKTCKIEEDAFNKSLLESNYIFNKYQCTEQIFYTLNKTKKDFVCTNSLNKDLVFIQEYLISNIDTVINLVFELYIEPLDALTNKIRWNNIYNYKFKLTFQEVLTKLFLIIDIYYKYNTNINYILSKIIEYTDKYSLYDLRLEILNYVYKNNYYNNSFIL